MPCIICVSGLHIMCEIPTEQKYCCCSLEELEPEPVTFKSMVQKIAAGKIGRPHTVDEFGNRVERNPGNVPRRNPAPLPEKVSLIRKEPKVYLRPVDTGRKRAAKIFPIEDGEQCNWAGLKSCGGGIRPIVGCRKDEERRATNIHHGPDKSTFNNSLVNLHHVCVWCHNRWHTWNDKYYGLRPESNSTWLPNFGIDRGEGEVIECLPHDPKTLATIEDFEKSREYWLKNRPMKAKGS